MAEKCRKTISRRCVIEQWPSTIFPHNYSRVSSAFCELCRVNLSCEKFPQLWNLCFELLYLLHHIVLTMPHNSESFRCNLQSLRVNRSVSYFCFSSDEILLIKCINLNLNMIQYRNKPKQQLAMILKVI